MRILIIIIFFLGIKFCSQSCWGQNLIPNYSFEDTIPHPILGYEVKNWKTPAGSNTEPEHYATYIKNLWGVPQNYFGYQNALQGKAYVGMAMYLLFDYAIPLRDYFQCKLKRSLIKDNTYCFRIYVSLGDSMQHASRGQLAVYFSNTAISSNSNFNLPYIPQLIISPTNYITDKVNWTEFNLQYTAQGGEQYLTMGNFNDTLKVDTLFVSGGNQPYFIGTYYYIDNLYLGSCDSLPKHFDVKINSNFNKIGCFTDSTTLNLNIKNSSVDSIDFTKDTLRIFTEVLQNNIVIQNFQQEINDNSLNHKGNLLGQDSSISINLNSIDLSQLGQTYQIKVYARLKPDEDTTNNIIDTIIVNNLSFGNVSVSNSSICAGTTVELKDEGSNGKGQWQYSTNQMDWEILSSDTIATHQPLETTFYRFVICDFYYSDTLQVLVNNPAVPSDTSFLFCKGLESLIIPSKQNNIHSFNWYNSTFEINPFFQGDTLKSKFFHNQTYYLGSKIDSCISLERGKITINIENCPINIPNIFTPNGDGVNDFFIYSDANGIINNSNISTTIFNRWGSEVAKWQGNIPWDGGDLEDGTYFYVVIADGVEYRGSVVILR